MEVIERQCKEIPEVTVICITYNQKKYITQALESMLMQKTNFNYEIIVHDDASTDGTADIVKKFAVENCEKITAILQNENQYQKKVKISTFTEPFVKGQYVALCEGDDFWISDSKLQYQYDMMQKYPQCTMCVHKVQGVDENGDTKIRQFPRFLINEGICTGEQVMHWMLKEYEWVFQTSSYFMRSELWRETKLNGPLYVTKSVYGDEALMRYSAAHGDFYYISEIMSCYRMNAIGSTVSKERRKLYNIDLYQRRLEVLKNFDVETNGRFHNDVVVAIEREQIGLLRAKKEYKELLRNKTLYSKLTKRVKIQVFISAYIPLFDNLYYGIRKLIRGY